MRTVVAYLAASLDGYIAGPGDDMGWLPEFDGDATGFHDFFREVGAIAMGRRTYEWIVDHAADWPYGELPAYVLSASLPAGPAAHVTITPGPVGDLAATLRDGEGIAWLVGGGGLYAAFAAADLIDLWIVTVMPVMLGAGVPMLPGHGGAYRRLELAETRTLSGGCVQSHYRPLR
jgi:dihydrofolate reductase